MLIKAALVNALLDKTRSTEPFALLAYNVWFAEHTATPEEANSKIRDTAKKMRRKMVWVLVVFFVQYTPQYSFAR